MVYAVISAPKRPDGATFNRTKEFLLRHEAFCVSLLERVMNHEVRFFLLVAHGGGDEIVGVFSYSDGGQMLHCFAHDGADEAEVERTLHDFFVGFDFSKLFSIIGEARGTSLLSRAVFSAAKKRPRFSGGFDLLCLECGGFRRGAAFSAAKIAVSDAGIELFDALKPIQRAYEEEEVLCAFQPFNPVVSAFLLKKAIGLNRLSVALSGGEIVGKANVNAVGVNAVQIGGVFTVPAFRRRGVARLLVEKIVGEQIARKKRVVLFVKPQNEPAQRLYASCGFSKFGAFSICYY